MNTKLQVLVIDDDVVIGRSFDRVLSEKGYDVSTALSGEEAMETIAQTDFDVVFTDIKMPGMNGLEVAERIKARCPWTPVVVITGYGSVANEDRAAVLGVNGFVRKPLTPEIIESVTLKAVNDTKTAAEEVNQAIEKVELSPAIHKAEENNAAVSKPLNLLKKIGVLFAAPFIGLAYIITLPFVGAYQFVKLADEAFAKKFPKAANKLHKAGTLLKNISLFFAAPFIALAYVVALPFVGFYMFAKLAHEAYLKR